MRWNTMMLAAAAAFLAAPAMAKDRPVTDDERTKLTAAVAAEGCTAGKMEFDDDGSFEVDDALCQGRKFDLRFDRQFKLLKKDPG
jgi:Peptidase propeptide and YPEB domain